MGTENERLPELLLDDAWVLVLSTIRYSLGRRSYIVGLSQDLYDRYKPYLLPWQRLQVAREVAEELRMYEDLGRTLGAEMDHKSWRAFSDRIMREEAPNAAR